jgi:hypothetical protein
VIKLDFYIYRHFKCRQLLSVVSDAREFLMLEIVSNLNQKFLMKRRSSDSLGIFRARAGFLSHLALIPVPLVDLPPAKT